MASNHVAGASVYAAFVMVLFSTLSFTGAVMPWWIVEAPGMKGTSTLWKNTVTTHVGTGGAAPKKHEKSASWDELCSDADDPISNPSDLCHRIRAIRAMVLLAFASGLASMGSAFGACGKSWPFLLQVSAGLALGGFCFSLTAVAVAASVETSAENDLVGGGFISVVLATVFSVLGAGLAFYASYRSGKRKAREAEVVGSAREEAAADAHPEVKTEELAQKPPSMQLPRMLGRSGSFEEAKLKEMSSEEALEKDLELDRSRDLLSI